MTQIQKSQVKQRSVAMAIVSPFVFTLQSDISTLNRYLHSIERDTEDAEWGFLSVFMKLLLLDINHIDAGLQTSASLTRWSLRGGNRVGSGGVGAPERSTGTPLTLSFASPRRRTRELHLHAAWGHGGAEEGEGGGGGGGEDGELGQPAHHGAGRRPLHVLLVPHGRRARRVAAHQAEEGGGGGGSDPVDGQRPRGPAVAGGPRPPAARRRPVSGERRGPGRASTVERCDIC